MGDVQKTSCEESNVDEKQEKKWPGYCKTLLVKDSHGTIKELVFPKALDLDRPKRERTTFSNNQLNILEKEFSQNQYLVGKDRTLLAARLGLSETQVKVWFQNRRTKHKKDKNRSGESKNMKSESKAAQNVLKLLEYRTAFSYNSVINNLPLGYEELKTQTFFTSNSTDNWPKQEDSSNKNIVYDSTVPVAAVTENHQTISRSLNNYLSHSKQDLTWPETNRNSTFDLSHSVHSSFKEIQASGEPKAPHSTMIFYDGVSLKSPGTSENTHTPKIEAVNNGGLDIGSSTDSLKSRIYKPKVSNFFIPELESTSLSGWTSNFGHETYSVAKEHSARLDDVFDAQTSKVPILMDKKVNFQPHITHITGSYSHNYPVFNDLDNFKSKSILHSSSGLSEARVQPYSPTLSGSSVFHNSGSLRNNIPFTSQGVLGCQAPSGPNWEFAYQHTMPHTHNHYGKVNASHIETVPPWHRTDSLTTLPGKLAGPNADKNKKPEFERFWQPLL